MSDSDIDRDVGKVMIDLLQETSRVKREVSELQQDLAKVQAQIPPWMGTNTIELIHCDNSKHRPRLVGARWVDKACHYCVIDELKEEIRINVDVGLSLGKQCDQLRESEGETRTLYMRLVRRMVPGHPGLPSFEEAMSAIDVLREERDSAKSGLDMLRDLLLQRGALQNEGKDWNTMLGYPMEFWLDRLDEWRAQRNEGEKNDGT